MDLLEHANEWAEQAEEMADNLDYEEAYNYKELETNCLREIITDCIEEESGIYANNDGFKNEDENKIVVDFSEKDVAVSDGKHLDFYKYSNSLVLIPPKNISEMVIINFDNVKDIDIVINCLNKIKKFIGEKGEL
jgi:hypothetical protein